MKNAFLTLILVLAAPLAHSTSLSSCADANVGLTALMAPASQNSKTYASNSIAVYNIDTEEPASASAGLAIVLGNKCFAITGLGNVNVMEAVSSYDNVKGLLLSVPTKSNLDGGISTLHIRISAKSSAVILE
jgi:hypothetical protein